MPTIQKQPLELFIDSLKKGSMQDFKILFDAYYPKVLCYIKKFTVEQITAEDLAQNVFIKLWLNSNQLIPVSSKIESYIFKIAKNEVLNHFRERETNLKYQKYLALELAKEYSIDEMIDAKQCYRMIEMIIDKMPAARKKIFIMSRIHNLSNDEIAIKLGISKRTVETQISLSLKQIRTSMATILSLLPILSCSLNFWG